ncbi:MAG: hypothetical protein HYU99_08265 [Deltaproteobacteria bacterium]|nr:hypothetical protein [Deltaproteobacteria bacterium]
MFEQRKKGIALILSLFVMPGFGHVYLGKKIRGYLISLLVCLILLALFILFERELLHQASLVSDQRFILFSIFDLAKKAWSLHRPVFFWGLGLIGLIWILAAVDVIREKK